MTNNDGNLRENFSLLPEEFTEKMRGLLGGEYPEFAACFDGPHHRALRMNSLKKRGKDSAWELPFCLSPVPWAENGYYYGAEDQPGRHPLHEAGVYYIQEPSAMAPVELLEPAPGEAVLDLCAAPGGKSTQIAAKMKGEGLLVCNEIHPARAKILSENIERMGVRNALVLNESPQKLADAFPVYFDRILVDAPCSGEGMFRRNEEARLEWSAENVRLCARRQDEILDCAARMLRPGGRLVYSTCTFSPEEDEGSVSRFLERHPEFSVWSPWEETGQGEGRGRREESARREDGIFFEQGTFNAGGFSGGDLAALGMSAGRPEWIPESAPEIEGTVRLWPHRLKGEGHYAAVLQKAGPAEAEDGRDGGQRMISPDSINGERRAISPDGKGFRQRPIPVGGLQRGIQARDCGEYQEFARENLLCSLSGIYLKFGDQLYLSPEGTPSLKGLKVLRPGLHLGTLKKNRFEPSHALALTLGPQEVVRSFDLPVEGPEIKAYLRGETISAHGEKGWYLICADGWSAGWGKLAGGIMKNHYPKGLRKGCHNV